MGNGETGKLRNVKTRRLNDFGNNENKKKLIGENDWNTELGPLYFHS